MKKMLLIVLIFSTGLLANDCCAVKNAIANSNFKKVVQLLRQRTFSGKEIAELKYFAEKELTNKIDKTFFSSRLPIACSLLICSISFLGCTSFFSDAAVSTTDLGLIAVIFTLCLLPINDNIQQCKDASDINFLFSEIENVYKSVGLL